MGYFDNEHNANIFGVEESGVSAPLFEALMLSQKSLTSIGAVTYENWSLALGEHESMLFAEVSTAENIGMAILDVKKKVVKTLNLNAITRYDNGEQYESNIAVLALAIRFLASEETSFNVEVNDFYSKINGITLPIDDDQKFDICTDLNHINSSLSLPIMHSKQSPLSALSKPAQTINLSQVEVGRLNPTKILCGEFIGFKTANTKIKNVSMSEIKDSYKLNPKREFTKEEKDMMFKVPNWYTPSANVISIAEKVKRSWDGEEHLRKTNILMEGPAGTGKTMDAKVLSALFGLPYTKVTCFSDMDSSDITGAILPVAEEEKKLDIPTDDDIFFDPAGSFEFVTGKKLSKAEAMKITEEDVRSAIEHKYEEFYASNEGQNTPRYVYYASEIVKAFEFGYLCEIQEPTCIADAAVFLILNSALEKDGVINLAQRTVKRHPETIFVVTTNRDYEGCRPLNQAIRDRFNIAKRVKMPSNEEQVERLVSATGCKVRPFLNTVVETFNNLNQFLKDNGINASVSMRGMIDFVADVMRGLNIRESVMEDIVYKITTDDDEVSEIENFIELSTSIYNVSL